MYHFGLSKIMDDLSAMFQQIKVCYGFLQRYCGSLSSTNFSRFKFICVGGSSKRLHEYAKLFAEKANVELSENLSKSDRYSMWTTGPVLWANVSSSFDCD
jgi:hypothetical protein